MTKKKAHKPLPKTIITQIVTLISTSFGLIAALAWNEAIKEYVDVFIKPHFAKGTGVISLFIYAILITIVAVIITVQSARLLKKIDQD